MLNPLSTIKHVSLNSRHVTTDSSPTRDRILDAAASVLSQRGYAGTRLSEIASIAGIQAPALYYYFDSRDALIEEVMRVGSARTRTFVADFVGELPPDATALARVKAAIEAHLRLILTMSDYATAATRNARQVPEKIRDVQLEEQRLYGSLWRDLLAAAVAEGSIRDDPNIGATRMFILGALNWTPEWWNSRLGTIDETIQTATRFILDGLLTGESSRARETS